MGGKGEDQVQQTPLLGGFPSSFGSDEEEPFLRTGNTWTAIAYIITGVIGAGVLSLAWSLAQLGWIAGPLMMIVFAATTIVSTYLLCDCYRSPDPEYGRTRNRSYMQAVRLYLGQRSERICGVLFQESMYGGGIAYVITAATSLRKETSAS